MKLLANENFPLKSIHILKNAGYDITSVGVEFSGITDNAVMEYASADGRIILTFDKDYGELIFRKGLKPKEGVIFLRWKQFAPDEPGEFLVELFKNKRISFTEKLTVISENSIRQRKY